MGSRNIGKFCARVALEASGRHRTQCSEEEPPAEGCYGKSLGFGV